MLLNKIYNNLYTIYVFIVHFIMGEKIYVVRTAAKMKYMRLLNFNWGDDFNFVLTKKIADRRVVALPDCYLARKLHIPNIMAIGSIITFFPLRDATIWGAGIININEIDRIKDCPDNILAVRGPLTRNVLIQRGIECPEVYGDPALLAPMLYQPSVKKIHKLGIIPHYQDIENSTVKEIIATNDVSLIKVSGYRDWESFIDEICKCDVIISSSLHGLIIAEAYGVPAVWVKFDTYKDGWDFKFIDFYQSIGKYEEKPIEIRDIEDLEIVLTKANEWRPGSIDLEGLIKACPFNMNC